jgi:hypothetical protein
MASNFVTDAITYILCRQLNEVHKRHYRNALKTTSLSHNISYFRFLLLLQELKETVQSVATINCAFNCSVFSFTTHGYRITINYLVSSRAQMKNKNVTF